MFGVSSLKLSPVSRSVYRYLVNGGFLKNLADGVSIEGLKALMDEAYVTSPHLRPRNEKRCDQTNIFYFGCRSIHSPAKLQIVDIISAIKECEKVKLISTEVTDDKIVIKLRQAKNYKTY